MHVDLGDSLVCLWRGQPASSYQQSYVIYCSQTRLSDQALEPGVLGFVITMLLKPFMGPLQIPNVRNVRPSLSLRCRFLCSLETGVPRCSATLRLGSKIRGQSGRLYTLDKVLQHREDLSRTIYRAM